MAILALSVTVILFIFISNYYFYKTDFRPRKYPLLYAIIETIADLFTNISHPSLYFILEMKVFLFKNKLILLDDSIV